MSLTKRVLDWRSQGEYVTALGDHRIFVTRRRGSGPPLLLLHGFPSSSFDWRALLVEPAVRGREVLAFDFLGFGLSDKPAGTYSLRMQADLVQELAGRFVDGPVFLVAHDMGTSVASELFAREIEGSPTIATTGALLFNGSMLLHLANPTLGQRLLRSRAGPVMVRLSSEWFFRNQLGSVFSKAHPLSPEEAADQWALVTHNGGNRRMHELIGYMDERVRFADRWHGAIRDWPGSLSMIWGMQDPVARIEVLRGLQELRPQMPVTELPGLGHYPQIENPAAVAEGIAAAAS